MNIAYGERIVECQKLIREFACEHINKFIKDKHEAELRAQSCVSQRDIQVCRMLHDLFFFIKYFSAGFYLLWLVKEDISSFNTVGVFVVKYFYIMCCYRQAESQDKTKSTSVLPGSSYIFAHPVIKIKSEIFEINLRALLVALGLVYYMRLDTLYRQKFVARLDGMIQSGCVNFKRAFTDEVCAYHIYKLCGKLLLVIV